LTSCLALQTFRQLVSEIALLALIVGCSIAGSLAYPAGTFGANGTIVRLATQLLSQEEARIASRTVVVLTSTQLKSFWGSQGLRMDLLTKGD